MIRLAWFSPGLLPELINTLPDRPPLVPESSSEPVPVFDSSAVPEISAAMFASTISEALFAAENVRA